MRRLLAFGLVTAFSAVSLADDDDAIRAVGVPDWILGHGEAPAWTGAAVPPE